MKLINFLLLIFLAVFILSGCGVLSLGGTSTQAVSSESIMTAAAATAFIRLSQTAIPPSLMPSVPPTETLIPTPSIAPLPTSIPTIVPIAGVMRANANVRGVPAKSKTHDLGGLLLGQPVKVIGRNDAANWLYIIFAESPSGTGWVTENAITLNGEMGLLPVLIYPSGEEGPVIMLPPFIFKMSGSPLPPSTPPADWQKYGTLTQPANVRIGPSVGFLTIGVLSPGQKVTFRGRIAENAWVQIGYPSGPDGKGWIMSSLVQANDGFGSLPYYNLLGTPEAPQVESPQPTSAVENTAVTNSTAAPTTATGPAATVGVDNSPVVVGTSTVALQIVTGADAEVTNQINVRAGPAQSYKSYGMLNPKEKVIVTGVTLSRYWYQIQYVGSPDGTGWVASQYIKFMGDWNKVRLFTNEGTPGPQ